MRALGISRIYNRKYYSVEEQKRRIDEYARELGFDSVYHVVLGETGRAGRVEEALVIHRKIMKCRAEHGECDTVIVFSWHVLGTTCRVVARVLAAIFADGMNAVHSVLERDSITRDMWEKQKDLLLKLGVTPPRGMKYTPEAVLEALSSLPISKRELYAIYTAIAKSHGVEAPPFYDVAAKEILSAEFAWSSLAGEDPVITFSIDRGERRKRKKRDDG